MRGFFSTFPFLNLLPLTPETLYPYFAECDGVSTDTRNILPNSLFFALKGDRFNGNTFAKQALENGARYAVIDEKEFEIPGKTLLCKDVLKTLKELASFHRKKLQLPIIGLTGSNGKTTTKELVNAVLSQHYKTIATKGNLNNHIGVPLTLLRMTEATEIGIVEMGANHLGEIKFLSELAMPDFGYITNFGKAHIEGFGSLEGVVQGKTELYRYLRDTDNTVFINIQDEKQRNHSEGIDRITFGPNNADISVSMITADPTVTVLYDGKSIKSHLIGNYHFGNIAAAIAIGAHFNVSSAAIKNAIEEYVPQMNRSEQREHHGHHLILDAYNANPTSMEAALKHFSKLKASHKIAILGDMFELGTTAAAEHQHITDLVNQQSIDQVYLVGAHFSATRHQRPHICSFNDFEAFSEFLRNEKVPKSHILIKGSRGMALERALPYL